MEAPSIVLLSLATFTLIGIFRSLFARPQTPQIIYVQAEQPQTAQGGGCLMPLMLLFALVALVRYFG
jgi:hypothetical protein